MSHAFWRRFRGRARRFHDGPCASRCHTQIFIAAKRGEVTGRVKCSPPPRGLAPRGSEQLPHRAVNLKGREGQAQGRPRRARCAPQARTRPQQKWQCAVLYQQCPLRLPLLPLTAAPIPAQQAVKVPVPLPAPRRLTAVVTPPG